MRSKKSLSFLEIVISLVILSIVLFGAWQLYQHAVMTSLRAERELVAVNLARALMNEIVCKRFRDPSGEVSLGPDPDEQRIYDSDNPNPFNDVDDYVDWSEDISSNEYIHNLLEQSFRGDGDLPNYEKYTFIREVEEIKCVSIQYYLTDHSGTTEDLRRENIAGVDTESTDFKRIVVKVSAPGMRDIELVEIRADLDDD